MKYLELVEELIKRGYLKTPRIIEAFKKIDRADFLPAGLKGEAWLDAPLPIGFGQTISQPLTVAFMLELLQSEPDDKILDIGAGSGWTTALLAHIVSQQGLKQKIKNKRQKTKGMVIAIERIPELVEFGKNNLAKYNFIDKGTVEFICADGSKGYPKFTSRPELVEGFDKILVGAACQEIPQAWKEQLKIGGRLVTPVQNSIWLLIKKDKDKFEEQEFPGFAFVPLVSEK